MYSEVEFKKYDLNKEYVKYNEDILTKKILSCKNIYLAAERFKSRFENPDMYFDYEDVDRRIKFCQKFIQFKERFNGKPLILLPWQEWVFANIFGWKWKEDGSRVTTKVLLFIARKNGKTTLSAALCLVQLFLDNNNGQEIDLIANNTKQAGVCFEYITKFANSLDPNHLLLRPFRDTIKMSLTDSSVMVRPNEYKTLDGLNPSTFICDEYHAATNSKAYDVLKSGQGFQTSPLAIVITSGGHNLDGFPLFEMRKACVRILEGGFEDESQFSALYELDEDDDWEDTSTWSKANPCLGHTLTMKSMLDDFRSAKNIAGQEPEFKSKHLNIFCLDESRWLEPEFIRDNMVKVDMSKFNKKEYVWAGVDLSTTIDLACFTLMWKPSKDRTYYGDKYIFKTWTYVTEYALSKSPNRDLYKQWIKDGYLTMIPGNAIDYDKIMYDMIALKDYVRFDVVGYDPFNATQFIINLEKKGFVTQAFSQKLGTFNAPTKEFERQLYTDNIIIDYSPLTLWAFNNAIIVHQKGTDNIKPDKTHEENKIDPVITIVESIGTYLYSQGLIGRGDTEIYTGNNKDANNK